MESKSLAPRIAFEEGNLVERPWARLSDAMSLEPIVIGSDPNDEDAVTSEDGATLVKYWKVTPNAEYGMPTVWEERLYVVMMELTREQGLGSPTVRFTNAQILEKFGLAKSGPFYERVERGLKRLKGVMIEERNVWHRGGKREHEPTLGFGILSDYRYDVRPQGRPKGDQPEEYYFTWSDQVFQSLHRYRKEVDVSRCLRLSDVAFRLYRYLDKKRYKKTAFQIGLKRLAHDQIGISRSKTYDSQLKQVLDKAHAELVQDGFLAGWAYEPMKKSEGLKVVYQFADEAPRVDGPTAETIEGMMRIGVDKAMAERLAMERPEACRRQLDFLPHRKGVRDQAATLVSSIMEDYNPPKAAEERERRDAEMRESMARAKVTKAAQGRKDAEREARYKALFDALSPDEQDALHDEAYEALSEMLRESHGVETHCQSAMRRILLKEAR